VSHRKNAKYKPHRVARYEGLSKELIMQKPQPKVRTDLPPTTCLLGDLEQTFKFSSLLPGLLLALLIGFIPAVAQSPSATPTPAPLPTPPPPAAPAVVPIKNVQPPTQYRYCAAN